MVRPVRLGDLDPTPAATPARSLIAALEPAPAGGPERRRTTPPAVAAAGAARGRAACGRTCASTCCAGADDAARRAGGGPGVVGLGAAGGVARRARGLRALTLAARPPAPRARPPLDRAVAELEGALRRSGRPAPAGTTLRQLEQRLGGSPEAAAYLRACGRAATALRPAAPTSAQRRALRRELAAGLGCRAAAGALGAAAVAAVSARRTLTARAWRASGVLPAVRRASELVTSLASERYANATTSARMRQRTNTARLPLRQPAQLTLAAAPLSARSAARRAAGASRRGSAPAAARRSVDVVHRGSDRGVERGDLAVQLVGDRAVGGMALAPRAQLDQVHRLARVEVEHVADAVAEAERVRRGGGQARRRRAARTRRASAPARAA